MNNEHYSTTLSHLLGGRQHLHEQLLWSALDSQCIEIRIKFGSDLRARQEDSLKFPWWKAASSQAGGVIPVAFTVH